MENQITQYELIGVLFMTTMFGTFIWDIQKRLERPSKVKPDPMEQPGMELPVWIKGNRKDFYGV